jgi:phosphoenolpyruvate carboxykinase (ATP)
MKLKFTRAIIDAIHSGDLNSAKTAEDPIFGFAVPTECPHVPTEILTPKNTWSDKSAYDTTAKKLAALFTENFKKYSDLASEEVRRAGPRL